MSDDTGNTAEKNGVDTDRYKRLRESKISPEAEYGYFYFPDRKGKQWTIWHTLNPFNFYARHRVRCETNLTEALESKLIFLCNMSVTVAMQNLNSLIFFPQYLCRPLHQDFTGSNESTWVVSDKLII